MSRLDTHQDLQHEEEPFPLLEYVQLLLFRYKLILVITILVGAIGYVHVSQMRDVYTAQSSILIGVQQGMVNDFNSYMRNYFSRMDSSEEIQILQSRTLAERVIENLNLLSLPEFNPALGEPDERFFAFLGNLDPRRWPGLVSKLFQPAVTGEVVDVKPNEEEIERRKMVTAVNLFLGKMSAGSTEAPDVIRIGFNSYDPKLAMRVANEIPEAYIVGQLEAKFEAAQKVTNWLSEQLEELKEQVEASERAVEIYRIEHDLTEMAGTRLLAEQISEINSQLIVARAERAEAEVSLAQMRRMLAEDREGLETAADVRSSPVIQPLLNQETEILRRRSEMAVEYGPKHPRMLQINAELEDIERRIDAEVEKVLIGLENDLERSRLREKSLARSLAELESQSGFQNQEAVQLRALEREAEANRTLFENFLSRFKETSTTEGMQTADARVLSQAELPRSPSQPKRGRILSIYVLLGFIGACALVLGLEFLNPGMHSPEQAERDLGEHVMGMIPLIGSKLEPHRQIIERPNSKFSEGIDSLIVSLKLSDPDHRARVYQVTSALPEEGKSSLVLSLAIALARSGMRVLLVDADLRRSTIEKRLGLPTDGPGLTDLVLSEDNDLSEFTVQHDLSTVSFMRTGDARYANAADLFTSKRMQHIVELMKQQYDFVLFDTPPVMAVADARVIGNVVDKTLFVVRWDKTPKKVARSALAQLHHAGAEIAGVVLQQVELKRYGRFGYANSGYYYHYGRYGKYYSS